MGKTKISWADYTFNPWIGCTKVSDGCAHCYAERDDAYRKWTPKGWGQGKPRRRTSESNWRQPLKWDREAAAAGVRRRVFCASLADVFDAEVDDAWRRDLFKLIESTPNLDWLLLTKRPERMKRWMDRDDGKIFDHIWCGVSVEDQATADERIPLLLQTPAAVRWISYEPAIGPVDFTRLARNAVNRNALSGQFIGPGGAVLCRDMTPSLDWIIVGGESGSSARPFDVAWARQTIEQCRAAGVACFVKQLGERPEGTPDGAPIPLDRLSTWDTTGERLDVTGKADDPSEWPQDLRVQEFPR